MTLDVANPYLRTKVLTAGPEQLRLMLIEGCLRFMREGKEAMARKDHEAQYEALTSARNIILELIGSMRHEVAPELCAKLESLYTYMFRALVDAGFERSAEKVDEVIGLMDYERETWLMLMDKVAAERNGSDVTPPEPESTGGAPRAHFSAEG